MIFKPYLNAFLLLFCVRERVFIGMRVVRFVCESAIPNVLNQQQEQQN